MYNDSNNNDNSNIYNYIIIKKKYILIKILKLFYEYI